MTTKPRTLLPAPWRAGIFIVLFSTAAAAQTEPGDPDINFLFSGEEIVSAVMLVGITIVIHGIGMIYALRAALTFRRWVQTHRFQRLFVVGVGPLILAGWIIFMTHLVEIWAWALFLYGVGAISNLANAYYFSLLQYATVGSDMTLPFHWRGFAGALPIAGLLSFAWSAAIMVTLSSGFQAEHLKMLEERRSKRRR